MIRTKAKFDARSCERWGTRRRSAGVRWRRTPKTGTTLIEVFIALTITTLVGAGVAAMLFLTSYGTSGQNDARNMLVSNEVAATHLGAALQASKMVLAKGDNYLVLWMADTRTNDEPDLSELRRIERDPETNELRSYRAPASLPEESDAIYELASTDFNAVTNALKGSADFPASLWGADITTWTTTVGAADPQQYSFVGFQVTTTMNGVSATKIGGAALRNH